MKMDLAKVCGFLVASIFPLTLLVDPTTACYCIGYPPPPLQIAFCTHDVVIRGSFAGVSYPDPNDMTWAAYDFRINHIFKGPNFWGGEVKLYSQMLGTTCGYRHGPPFSDVPYLVIGNLDGDRITISACSVILPWLQLTVEDSIGLVEGLFRIAC